MEKKRIILPIVFSSIALFGQNIAVYGKDNSLNIPPSVMSAFKANYPQSKIRGTSKEVKNGKTYYEIESTEGKTRRDILYYPDGAVAEIEEPVSVDSLPQPVNDSLAARFPGAKVQSAERLTRGDTVDYEVVIKTGKGKKEVVLGSDGRAVSIENASEEAKEEK